jgi:hypothetical protein
MFEIILCVTGIVTLIIGTYACLTAKKKNTEVEEYNQTVKEDNLVLTREKNSLLSSLAELRFQEKQIQQDLTNQISEFDNVLKKQQSLSQNAFANYCEVLDKDYKDKEEEYDNLLETMRLAYEKQQLAALQEWEKVKADLDKIKATRAATIQARIQEEQIREQREFYMLCPKNTDIADIKRLEGIKPELNNPRILSMLIWSTFFQKPMTTLCNNVLGTSTITGIYKITNQENEMCYIGQAVDVATRWKNHAKCGLGIDTPAGNKLYKAMQEFGIWNFTWELLEECPANQLNEKEQYYIDLYDSFSYGYNSNKGVSKH